MHIHSRTKKAALTTLLMMSFVTLCGYVWHLDIRSASCLFGMLGIYATGIIWIVSTAHVSKKHFSLLFQSGFKSFILITFLMIIFFIFFYKFNPQILDEFIKENNRLITKMGSRTPSEMETNENLIRSYFVPMTISFYTLVLLITGAISSALTAVLVSRSNK